MKWHPHRSICICIIRRHISRGDGRLRPQTGRHFTVFSQFTDRHCKCWTSKENLGLTQLFLALLKSRKYFLWNIHTGASNPEWKPLCISLWHFNVFPFVVGKCSWWNSTLDVSLFMHRNTTAYTTTYRAMKGIWKGLNTVPFLPVRNTHLTKGYLYIQDRLAAVI